MRPVCLVLTLSALASTPVFANPEITVDLPGGATMDFVWIEPRTFMIGSAEWLQHEVTITKGFYLGKYEIAQGQWESEMGTTPWEVEGYVQSQPNHPAVYISWDGENTAVGEDNAQTSGHTTGELTGRLPHEVGTKLPNPWGLYDMHGNVWEWCQDWYEEAYYIGSPSVDPWGPATGTDRVVRGGSVSWPPSTTWSWTRGWIGPSLGFSDLGARLLMAGPTPTSVTPETWGRVKALQPQ
ncbi:formylglycine-generating enzyme family protein [Candidatus Latescibacterota bacterium]